MPEGEGQSNGDARSAPCCRTASRRGKQRRAPAAHLQVVLRSRNLLLQRPCGPASLLCCCELLLELGQLACQLDALCELDLQHTIQLGITGESVLKYF